MHLTHKTETLSIWITYYSILILQSKNKKPIS